MLKYSHNIYGSDGMKIKYLGTAAAEGVPAIFCACDTCKKARANGGKDIRTRSQALIDGKLLIDFGADTYSHVLKYGLDLTEIRECLITHVHSDHYYPAELEMARTSDGGAFAHVPEGTRKFGVYGSKDILNIPENMKEFIKNDVAFVPIEPYVSTDVAGYSVTPLRARHGSENPYNYLISDGKKTLFYAHDTGLFLDEVWEYFEKNKPHIDFISLDCTEGNKQELPYTSHQCIGYNVITKEKLEKLGVIDENTVIMLNHFSHNGKDILYDDFAEIAKSCGFDVSYDGLEVEI